MPCCSLLSTPSTCTERLIRFRPVNSKTPEKGAGREPQLALEAERYLARSSVHKWGAGRCDRSAGRRRRGNRWCCVHRQERHRAASRNAPAFSARSIPYPQSIKSELKTSLPTSLLTWGYVLRHTATPSRNGT